MFTACFDCQRQQAATARISNADFGGTPVRRYEAFGHDADNRVGIPQLLIQALLPVLADRHTPGQIPSQKRIMPISAQPIEDLSRDGRILRRMADEDSRHCHLEVMIIEAKDPDGADTNPVASNGSGCRRPPTKGYPPMNWYPTKASPATEEQHGTEWVDEAPTRGRHAHTSARSRPAGTGVDGRRRRGRGDPRR